MSNPESTTQAFWSGAPPAEPTHQLLESCHDGCRVIAPCPFGPSGCSDRKEKSGMILLPRHVADGMSAPSVLMGSRQAPRRATEAPSLSLADVGSYGRR